MGVMINEFNATNNGVIPQLKKVKNLKFPTNQHLSLYF